jgi:hypothetical protein
MRKIAVAFACFGILLGLPRLVHQLRGRSEPPREAAALPTAVVEPASAASAPKPEVIPAIQTLPSREPAELSRSPSTPETPLQAKPPRPAPREQPGYLPPGVMAGSDGDSRTQASPRTPPSATPAPDNGSAGLPSRNPSRVKPMLANLPPAVTDPSANDQANPKDGSESQKAMPRGRKVRAVAPGRTKRRIAALQVKLRAPRGGRLPSSIRNANFSWPGQ